MMKGIYKAFASDLQHSIKVIAERHGISPLVVLTSTNNEVFSEFMTELENIENMFMADFPDMPKEDIKSMYDTFMHNVMESIAPGYIPVPKNSTGLICTINRRLVDEGYSPVEPEALSLIIEEFILPAGE